MKPVAPQDELSAGEDLQLQAPAITKHQLDIRAAQTREPPIVFLRALKA